MFSHVFSLDLNCQSVLSSVPNEHGLSGKQTNAHPSDPKRQVGRGNWIFPISAPTRLLACYWAPTAVLRTTDVHATWTSPYMYWKQAKSFSRKSEIELEAGMIEKLPIDKIDFMCENTTLFYFSLNHWILNFNYPSLSLDCVTATLITQIYPWIMWLVQCGAKFHHTELWLLGHLPYLPVPHLSVPFLWSYKDREILCWKKVPPTKKFQVILCRWGTSKQAPACWWVKFPEKWSLLEGKELNFGEPGTLRCLCGIEVYLQC